MRPEINPGLLDLFASARSIERGLTYVEHGRVRRVMWRGTTLWGRVEGSGAVPYTARVAFDGDAVTSATCTCPYDWGGWCKHLVAVVHTACLRGDALPVQPALEARLAEQPPQTLIAILDELIAWRPDLVEPIEAMLRGEAPDWVAFDEPDFY